MPSKWVEALIAKLLARYGSLFTDRYAGVPRDMLVSEWASELAGYSVEEIRRGLDACRTVKFPPTLPEFQQLCRPPIDVHAAFVEACDNMRARERGENPAWSHPALFWAALDVSHFDMRSQPYVALRGRWEAALSKQLRKSNWAPIPPAFIPLPEPEPKRNPEAVAKLRTLMAKLRASTTTTAKP